MIHIIHRGKTHYFESTYGLILYLKGLKLPTISVDSKPLISKEDLKLMLCNKTVPYSEGGN